MEAEVGLGRIFGAGHDLRHRGVGGGDALDVAVGGMRSRECRGAGLHDLAHLVHGLPEGLVLAGGDTPAQDLRIEHVPIGLRPHGDALLGARND